MRIEARLVSSGARGARVHRTGMGTRNAMRAAQALAQMPGDALVVIGFCGGLGSGLVPGEIVIADRVYAAGDEGHAPASIEIPGARQLADAFAGVGLPARVAPIVSVARLALGQRRAQLLAAGALAVDMESAWLHPGAGARPFAVVRVVLDTPERELLRPGMVPVALRAGGVLRRTARALQDLAERHGLHTLLPADRSGDRIAPASANPVDMVPPGDSSDRTTSTHKK